MHPEPSRMETIEEIERVFHSQSKEILDLYREHIPDYLNSLESAWQSEDRKEVQNRSHKLNSAMKTIGFLPVAERLSYIEMAHPGDASIEPFFEEVKSFINSTLCVLDTL